MSKTTKDAEIINIAEALELHRELVIPAITDCFKAIATLYSDTDVHEPLTRDRMTHMLHDITARVNHAKGDIHEMSAYATQLDALKALLCGDGAEFYCFYIEDAVFAILKECTGAYEATLDERLVAEFVKERDDNMLELALNDDELYSMAYDHAIQVTSFKFNCSRERVEDAINNNSRSN